MIPAGARGIVQAELMRLAHAPHGAMSAQGLFALLVGLYASHRGFKAMLAGLSFIHDEDEPHGFVGFNLMALVVLVATFAMRQLYTPRNLLAQVSTAGASLKIGAYAVGAAAGGWVVPSVGPLTALVIVAGLHLAAALLGYVAARGVWSALPQPEPASHGTVAAEV